MTDYRDSATRFFWAWLISGAAASILGNVTHALLSAGRSGASAVIAACMALAPPVVLLLATYGVHALVRSRIVGRNYWAALAITVALACCAFVLSFEALHDLATTYGGMRSTVAWLWPLAIDLSITGSTVALLALSGAERDEQLDEPVGAPDPVVTAVIDEHHEHVYVPEARTMYLSTVEQPGEPIDDDQPSEALASVEVYHVESAGRMVEAGVTRIDALRVARVLAEYDAETAPSTIARKLSVGYETVVKILDHYAGQRVEV